MKDGRERFLILPIWRGRQRDNQVAQKDRWLVSTDGQQMTLSSAGTLETGQRITEKLVFKKQ